MAASFWDIMKIIGPLAAGAAGTPAAGMAVGAAMQGGEKLAQGDSMKEALLAAAMGGGAQAAGQALPATPESVSPLLAEGEGSVLSPEGLQAALGQAPSSSERVASFLEHMKELGNYAELGSQARQLVSPSADPGQLADLSALNYASLPGPGPTGGQRRTPGARQFLTSNFRMPIY